MTAEETDLVYGQHAVDVLLDQGAERIVEIWLQQGRETKLAKRLQKRFANGAVPLHLLSRLALDGQFSGARHQGVVVRVRPGAKQSFKALLAGLNENSLLVILDGVEDPHNLGAVLRSADAAGADAVIIPRSRGVGLTAVVRKVASGAAESVPLVEVANLARAMAELAAAGVCLMGADHRAGVSLFEAQWRGAVALVFGAEGAGLRRLTLEQCTQTVALPMRGQVQSLNVSVAAGICLFEVLRRRLGD